MSEGYINWIKRAESSLALAKVDRDESIFYEDLCFQLQQASEKILKAFLLLNNVSFPKTHSFRILLKQIKEITEYPDSVRRVIELEDYAVQTRYPGDYTPVEKEEYLEALEITENVFKWVKGFINTKAARVETDSLC